MKFTGINEFKAVSPAEVRVGDIFRARQNGPDPAGGARFLVVAGITGATNGDVVAHLLVITADGDVVATRTLTTATLQDCRYSGVCPELASLKLNVLWSATL